MKKNLTVLLGLLFLAIFTSAQEWEQTVTTPEGGGITEIVVNPENDHIFVTTGSYNWPNGDDGGVRRSTDDGDTWENLYDAYNGRTITLGADGNLYASIWPYPQDEGLYRSTDNGNTWQLLVTVPSGNNIFSITVSTQTNPHTIFAGTRNGVYRSTDNGTTWAFSSSGIPANSWIRDIEVDSTGAVVAATHSGLFSSFENGNVWQQATGDGIENDSITKIIFDYPFDSKDETRLIAGTNNGKLYESFSDSKYLTATLLTIFAPHEISGITTLYLKSENKKMHGISEFPKGSQPSGFKFSTDNCKTWHENNNGLPGSNPPLSALSGRSTPIDINLRAGFYQNMNGGAKVFKITYDWSSIVSVENHILNISSGLNLSQNFPNPFGLNTQISFFLENSGKVSLKIYTTDGRLVRTLLNRWHSIGKHQFIINTVGLNNGIYYYMLESDGISEVKKMIVLK